MKTRQARLQQIENARTQLRDFDDEAEASRMFHLLTLRNAFRAFVGDYPGSLRELARRTGLSVAFLSDVTHGRRTVSDRLIDKLAKLK